MATLSRKNKANILKFTAIDYIKHILTSMKVLNHLLDQTNEFLNKTVNQKSCSLKPIVYKARFLLVFY